MRRSLIHYWPANLAVILAAAVTTAVLTGALLVGDSVRGSLRALTQERLGDIKFSLTSARFFRQQLGLDIMTADNGSGLDAVVPAIFLPGSAVHSSTRARATGVQVFGVNDEFWRLFNETSPFSTSEDDTFPGVVINQSLARSLGAAEGDQILLSLVRPTDVNPGFLLGSRDENDLTERLRLSIGAILPDQGVGRFGLQPNQTLPLNAFLPLAYVQEQLGQPARVNVLLSSTGSDGLDLNRLNQLLHGAMTPADFHLKLRTHDRVLILESNEMILSPPLEQAALDAAAEMGLEANRVFTYLANRIETETGAVPYSTVSGIEGYAGGSAVLRSLQPGEILLNRWTADELSARSGDQVTLTYFVVGPGEELVSESHTFRLVGILPMEGLAVDSSLTPPIAGVEEAPNMSDWDPPIPIDLSQIRPEDEEYWDRYRAAPKGFIHFDDAVALWRTRFGQSTSIRLQGEDHADPATFRTAQMQELDADQLGLEFIDVRKAGLEAASGATDFGMLFIGFSLFLIISALLLVALLFRLSVERRGREIGLLLAAGFTVSQVRRRLLREGGLLVVLGALLGSVGALLYGWLMITGLRTLWSQAVGTTFLFLYVEPVSLAAGVLMSFLIVLFSIWFSIRRLSAIDATQLLAGLTVVPDSHGLERKWKKAAMGFCLVLAGLLTILAMVQIVQQAVAFFAVGALLLIAGLVGYSLWMGSQAKHALSPRSIFATSRLAARNSSLRPGRSLLSAALVAAASFVIVAVAANRHQPGTELLQRNSGAGGFNLVATTDVPLYKNLNDPEQRQELGLDREFVPALSETNIFGFRFLPGEDVSCLNLYRPEKPRLLGVPPEIRRRGGFSFSQLVRETEQPWSLLTEELEPGVIPAFGDANSMQWILHLGLGEDLILENERGEQIRLRLVGLLTRSIFQSEVLISEENFLEHFPGRSGFSYFLIDTPDDASREVLEELEGALSAYGFDARTTAEALSAFLAVENTYLSTFQLLGGLGLLLGTLGLAVVLMRNVLERKAELAAMRAFGFQRSTLALLVLLENLFILVLGLTVGSLSALIAVAPHWLGQQAHFPWMSLTLTLLSILAVGSLAALGAARLTLRTPLLPSLRAE